MHVFSVHAIMKNLFTVIIELKMDGLRKIYLKLGLCLDLNGLMLMRIGKIPLDGIVAYTEIIAFSLAKGIFKMLASFVNQYNFLIL